MEAKTNNAQAGQTENAFDEKNTDASIIYIVLTLNKLKFNFN